MLLLDADCLSVRTRPDDGERGIRFDQAVPSIDRCTLPRPQALHCDGGSLRHRPIDIEKGRRQDGGRGRQRQRRCSCGSEGAGAGRRDDEERRRRTPCSGGPDVIRLSGRRVSGDEDDGESTVTCSQIAVQGKAQRHLRPRIHRRTNRPKTDIVARTARVLIAVSSDRESTTAMLCYTDHESEV